MNSKETDKQMKRREDLYELFNYVLESLLQEIRIIRWSFDEVEKAGGDRSILLGGLDPYVCDLNDLCFISKQNKHKS